MQLHNKESEQPETKLIVQKKLKLPVSKNCHASEEKVEKDLINLSITF
jgi:hypothetical protein